MGFPLRYNKAFKGEVILNYYEPLIIRQRGVTIIMVMSGVKQLIAKLIYDRGLSFRDGH
jgi:hypothetical protein